MVNALLLRKELEYVTVHREEWNQGTWLRRMYRNDGCAVVECGTMGCLAGNTALHAGWVPDWRGAPTTDYVNNGVVTTEVCVVAGSLLDLERYQAKALFEASNTLIALWMIAEIITDGEIQIPIEVAEEFKRKTEEPGDWWEGCSVDDVRVEANNLLDTYRSFTSQLI